MILRKSHILLIAVFAVSILFSSCKKEDPPPQYPWLMILFIFMVIIFYVNWIGVVGATGYYVDVATDQNFSNFLPDYTNKEVAINGMFIVEGLTPNTSYYVRMRAINAHGSSGNSVAQQFNTRAANVLPNMDMEEWITYPNYENPAPEGVWASANKVVDLLPGVYPVLLFKSEDSYSGTYAAKARTDSASGMPLLTGSLSTGLFNVNLQNPLKSLITGVPYKSRPTKFQGYYKYLGVGGDSCEIRTTLSKWNAATKERDVIGGVVYRTTDLVDVYTFFDLEVVYFSTEEPDTIDVVFAASAGGEYFKGKIGSTIFVDDFTLTFE